MWCAAMLRFVAGPEILKQCPMVDFHSSATRIYGKDENYVQLTLRKIQKTKAFRDYTASRGKVDYIQTYQVTTAKRF